jgi:Rhs element Vgr protein
MIDLSIKIQDTLVDKKFANVTVYKDVNKIPTASITILDGNVAQEDFKESSGGIFDPGKEVEIIANKEPIFKGVIIKHRILIDGISSKLILECKDKVVALTIARKSRCSSPDEKEDSFLKKVVLKGYAGTIDTFKETQKNIVQHDCTDWDFTLSRAELQGMLVSVESGKVSIKKPALGKSINTLKYGKNLKSFKGEIDPRYQFSNIKSTGWDYKKQAEISAQATALSLKNTGVLTTKNLSKVLNLGAIELQTTGQLETAELTAWASAQRFKSHMAMIRGTASCKGKNINLLQTVTLKGLSTRFNGEILVTGVRHEIAKGLWTTVIQFGLPQRWFSRSDDFQGAPANGLLPAIQGLQIGKVLEQADKDPDKQDRIKISLPTIDAKNGIWARQALFSTGTIFRPVKDDEVVAGFLNDDPRQAIILGVLNNKDALTPVKSTEDVKNEKLAIYEPHNKGKDVYIQFDKEAHSIEVKTKERSILLNEKEKEIQIKNDATTIIMTEKEIKLTADNIVLEGSKTIDLKTKDATIKASGALNLSGKDATLKGNGGGVTVDGKPSTTIKGAKVSVKAKSTLTLEGKAKADLKGAMASVKGKAITKVG